MGISKFNRMSILMISTFVLSGCERVSEEDIRSACAKLSTTLEYQAAERLAIIHELDKKAGKGPSSASGVKYRILAISIRSNRDTSWEQICIEKLSDDYRKKPKTVEEETIETIEETRLKRDQEREEILSVAQTTNLFCPRSVTGKYDGVYDHVWIAAQLHKVEGEVKMASVYAHSPKRHVDGYCRGDYESITFCLSVYVERDPHELLSKKCDFGILPFCARVGKSLVFAEVHHAGGRGVYGIYATEDTYDIDSVDGFIGGMHLNRKTLEAQIGSHAKYQCEPITEDEFSEKVIEPIRVRYQDVVDEETKKLKKLLQLRQEEINSIPQENQI